MREWTIQDARNKLNELVNSAESGEPQRVTRRGQPAVVILAAEDFDRLRNLEESNLPSFSGLFLEIPQDDQEFDRPSITPRPQDD